MEEEMEMKKVEMKEEDMKEEEEEYDRGLRWGRKGDWSVRQFLLHHHLNFPLPVY